VSLRKPKAPLTEGDKPRRVVDAIRDLCDADMRLALWSAMTTATLRVGKRQAAAEIPRVLVG
jgi:hypothetical protein